MSDGAAIAEAELLIDSYGRESSFVRLAMLASPACRIEPQLLRRLRLDCVPDADVSIEQELWFSELVASRGQAITFSSAVSHSLRARLHEVRDRPDWPVATARDVVAAMHADLPRVLRLEDELGWAEVDADTATMQARAQDLLAALLAGRDGLDYWLARAWTGLPSGLRASPAGEQLAEVAAARGAPVGEPSGDDGPPIVDDVIHLLPTVTVLLQRTGAVLVVPVGAGDATHAIDIPDTRSKLLAVRSDEGSWSGSISGPGATTITVGSGQVAILTESGAEYGLEALAMHSPPSSAALDVTMFPAGDGTSILISFGSGDDLHHVLVDAGPQRTGRFLAQRFREDRIDRIDVLVLTHIDENAIGGAIELLSDQDLDLRIDDVWFNTIEDRW